MSSEREMIRAEEPNFLRFITHDDHLLQGKLPIPRKFMREYGSALSDSVLIKVPSGLTWKVVLIKSGDRILFGKGWEEFVLYHELMCGHSMIFRYEGGCNFRVSILDNTSTEINYPCSSTNTAGEEDLNGKSKTEERKIKVEEEEEEEDANEVPRCLKRKCKKPMPCFKPQERRSNTDKNNGNEDADPELINEHPQSHRKKRRVRMRCLKPQKRAKVKAKVDWNLPEADVEDQEGEECMPSKYQKRRSGRTRVGNTERKLKREKKADALRRADAFKSANPFFKVVLQPTYIQNGYLPIPSSFSKLHLGKQCLRRATLSCRSGGIWPVRFYDTKTHKRITSGWAGFVKDNGVEDGDVCVFELIKKATEKTSFKVVIFRAAEDAQFP